MEKKIQIKNITKKIKKTAVLKDVSAEFKAGTIYGIIGENGAGKTMLFRVLAGLVFPDEGQIFYGEEPVKSVSEKMTIGMTLENIGLYQEMTLFDNLCCIAGLSPKKDREQIKAVIERVGLDSGDKKKYGKYSLGMKQRGTLAQALLGQPDLLLLDEPFNGLDEEGTERFRRIILEEAQRGAIVVLTSHNREDIKLLCQVVYQMKDGTCC